MKQISKIIIALVVMVAFSITANAQKCVVGDVQDFASCKAYLQEHPADTIVDDSTLVSIRVYVKKGHVVRTATPVAPTTYKLSSATTHKVKAVKKSAEGVQRVEKNNAETEFTPTTIKGMNYQDQIAFLRGDKEVYNIRNRGLDGRLQQRYTIYALGGAFYGDAWAPQVTLGLSHAFWPHIDLGVEVEYSKLEYVGNAEAAGGKYDSFAGYLTAKYFPFQNKYLGGGSRLGFGLSAGYMLQRTDSEEALQSSKNYGASAKFFLEYDLSLGGNWYIMFQAGGKWYPRLEHNSSQKFLDYIGGYGQIGGAYRF